MANRPDYVKCVRTGMHVQKTAETLPLPETMSWCGRDTANEFAFVDASHAALNAKHRDYLLICPKCAAAIVSVLNSHTWQKGKKQ